MKRHRDLMHGFSVQLHRPHPSTNECARFDRAAQAHNRNVIAIVDLEFGRQLGRHFREQFRLQFGEVTEKTRHPAGGMMLGQAISREDKWKSRIARRRETIFITREPIHHRVGVARVKRVLHRRLERFVMRRHRSVLQTFRDVQASPVRPRAR